ncbi:hypothetical protein SLEP1_g37143 [Rubroshorea leprosula]|uniref:Uncharacterized protein n=1 Tax=Rubroshorea leprosula TaxID=152421 RepID=A0AAV5KUF5_9ROSI|nr:hypothetical protein SLEP1_g37143 [Rubroshorea leprosula]
MGGRGRKKKDAPPRGGSSKEVAGAKSVENVATNSPIEDAVKAQVEVVKLAAKDLELMGLVVEEVGNLQSDPRDPGVDEATEIESRKEAVVTQVLTNLEEGQREGKRVVGLDTQSPESPAKLLIGTNGASSSGVKPETPRVRWIDLVDGEKDEVLTQPLRKPVRSWSSVVQGNRDIRKGWELQYVKPQDPSGAVVITEDEWMLVEVEIMEELPQVVPVVGPKGIFQQPVIFEWSPVRCGNCGNLGHEERNSMVQVEPNILSEVVVQQCKHDEVLESTVVVDKEMPIMESDHVKGTVIDDGNVTALFPEVFSRQAGEEAVGGQVLAQKDGMQVAGGGFFFPLLNK